MPHKISSAARAVSLLPGVDLVMERPQGREAAVALVKQSATEKYAVCRMDFRRLVVSAPVCHDHSDGAQLAAVMDEDGLRRVLRWTDREAALSHFADLALPVADQRRPEPR